jgi:hypothetical protein
MMGSPNEVRRPFKVLLLLELEVTSRCRSELGGKEHIEFWFNESKFIVLGGVYPFWL